MKIRAVSLAVTVVLTGASMLSAQVAGSADPVAFRSLGQPPLVKPYVAGSFTWNREGKTQFGGVGIAGVYKDLALPVSGALGVSAEGYVGGLQSVADQPGGWDGGARVFATSRLFFLNLGVDWSARTKRADFILAFTPYLRRGGLFGTGGNFRIEWIPGRDHTFNVGFQIPLEPHMGQTRPVKRDAELPAPGPRPRRRTQLAPTGTTLGELRQAARWLVMHANVLKDEDDASYAKAMDRFRDDLGQVKKMFATRDARHPDGRNYALEARHYHESFDALFVEAAGPQHGRAVAERAREIVLDEILLPYDRLIGRFKKPDTLRGFAGRGRAGFDRTLVAWPGLDPSARAAAMIAFDRIVDVLEEGRVAIREHWDGDERKSWIPLDLALRLEQHDTQEELDALIGRALGRPFTRGNTMFPTNASRFQLELVRSIHTARDYHVLWIHDFAGIVGGKPDPVAHAVTVGGYLRAMAERIREYDQTGRLPSFFIFHTQFFYEGSKSRLYLSLLEDPLDHEMNLGSGNASMEKEVRDAQEALRLAVASSRRLQAAARRHGKKWLRDVVKVHVSVTFPADLSFRSSRILDALPFAPDMVTLDHRKLFFYDVTEEDPSKGEAVFTGTGVGSEYAGPTWDDRGLMVSGPAPLQLRVEARRLLRSQGFREDQIPEPLRERATPVGYEALLDRREKDGFSARALNVHNEVGFGRKEATLAQAILYTLAPPGTMIVAPDSIWVSPLWAGQLAGAALRGCHVYIVAPSMDNAPAASTALLARTREIFSRLLEVRRILAGEITAPGGLLRVGLYTRAAPSGDTLGKVREAAAGLRLYPFLREELPMPKDVAEVLDSAAKEMEALGYTPRLIAEGTREGRPKMHRKTQIFFTRKAARALMDQPGAANDLREQLLARAKATADPEAILQGEDPLTLDRPMLDQIRLNPSPGTEKALYYLTVGSKNQDPRSAFLDGETTFVVAGPWSLFGYSDFILLMAATTWVENDADLLRLIPIDPQESRRAARLIRKVL